MDGGTMVVHAYHIDKTGHDPHHKQESQGIGSLTVCREEVDICDYTQRTPSVCRVADWHASWPLKWTIAFL